MNQHRARKAQKLPVDVATGPEQARIFEACVHRLCEIAGVIRLTPAGRKAGYRGSDPDDIHTVQTAFEYGRMAAGLYRSWAAFEASILWTAIRDLPCSPRFLQWQALSDKIGNAAQPEQPMIEARVNKANPGITKRAMTADRVLALRDMAIAVVRRPGAWDRVTRDLDFRLTAYRWDDLLVALRTPFQRIFGPPVPQPAKYLVALSDTAAPENLPYGIDVCWRERKQLNIEWADDGGVCLVCYEPGDWEGALERLAA
jgi:hypothetical protein